jgi:two-component system response regulator HydG
MNDSSVVRILIVEDERNHAVVLAELLNRAGYQVIVANSFEDGKKSLQLSVPDLIITDLHLGAHRGTKFLELAQEHEPAPEVMLISGVGSIDDAVRSLQLGAQHYFTKPLNVSEIRTVVEKAAQRIRKRKQGGAKAETEEGTATGFEGIIGTSPAIQKIFDTIKRIAPSTATVLIQGENGTGKELVARAIHNLSLRSEAPFVALNCGALSEGILESELFGHERGAFTGANQAREGKFSFANKGTLFLDELGDMPLSLQVKLLRVLEEREVTPVGSNKSRKVDVRLLAATNKDLVQEIKTGRFREDLYYRIKVVSIYLPPLRDRREDIPMLVDSFIKQFATIHQRPIVGIDGDSMSRLLAEPWPGNVRQLRNVIENMVVLAEGTELTVTDLPDEIRPKAHQPSTALVTLDEFASYTLEQWEKELIRLQLARHEGNRSKVAKALGVSERTLYRKLKEYGIK